MGGRSVALVDNYETQECVRNLLSLRRLARPGLPWVACTGLPVALVYLRKIQGFLLCRASARLVFLLSEVTHCSKAVRDEGVQEFVIMVCPSLFLSLPGSYPTEVQTGVHAGRAALQ